LSAVRDCLLNIFAVNFHIWRLPFPSWILGKEIWCEDDWIQVAQNKAPLVVSCEHGNEPSGSLKGGEFIEQLSDS
jgi:hypothetical protein